MAQPKTANVPRGTVKGSASQDLVRFTIRAVPLQKNIHRFILDNIVTLKKLHQGRKTRDTLSDEEAGSIEEGADIYGDVVRRPSVRPEQFWDALDETCKAVRGEWEHIVDRIWCFGPQKIGGCLLIDARKSPLQSCVFCRSLSHRY